LSNKTDKNIGKKAKKGIFWVLIGNFGYEAILFISSVILARLLDPNDFGIAGVAVLITNYLKRLRVFGFGLAIVQKKNITEDHLNAVFLSNFSLGVILWAVIFFTSGYIGNFFNSPVAGEVAVITSLTFLINPFSSVQASYLRRNMHFKKLTYVHIVADLVMNGAQIAMALMGFGVWSLAYPRLLEPAILAIVLSTQTRYWPKFKYNKEAMKEIFSFGFWVFIRSQINYLAHNMDFLLVGKFLGTESLGFYERAYNVMNRPQKRVTGHTESVLLSAYSRMQEEKERIRRAFRKVMLSMTIVNIPIQIGMLSVAPSFVYVLFGAKWMPVVIPLQILNISGLFSSIIATLTPIVTSHGYVKENAFRSMASVSIFAILAYFAVDYGINGMSVAVILYRVADLIIIFVLVRSFTSIRIADLFASVWPSLASAALMLCVVETYQFFIRPFIPSVGPVMLFSSVAVGAIAYFASLFIFKFQEFVEVRDELIGDLKPHFFRIKNKLTGRKAFKTNE